jgi:hypothetical protein
MAYTCPRGCYGQVEPGFDDICVANRKSVDDPFGNFRVITQISSASRYERDPAWTYDSNGQINGIIWVANPGNDPIGGTNAEVCRAGFDPNAETTCVIDPAKGTTGPCTGVADNPMENGEPACRVFNGAGSTIVASDPFSAETCPEFTGNMRYFSFGRSGLTTTGFDLFLAGSSNQDGVLDEWYGALTNANSDQHDFGIGIAPPPFGDIVAWTRANDIVFFSDTTILLGRLPIKTGE